MIKTITRGKDGKPQVFNVDTDSLDEARQLVSDAMREDEGVASPVVLSLVPHSTPVEEFEPEVA